MNDWHGYLGVIVAILAWGSYTVPLKRAQGLSPIWFQVWLSVGIGASSLLLGWVHGFHSFSLWGVLAGLVWTGGAAGSFFAVQKEGLSGSSTRWMGTGILVSFLCGIVVLHEHIALGLGVLGVLFLLLGLVLVSKAGDHVAGSSFRPWQYWRSISAGLIFGSYLLPMQLAHVASMDFVAPMGAGILLGGLALALLFRPQASPGLRWVSVGCGIAWNCANIGSLWAVQGLGFAVGFPLTQLALLVSVSLGVFYFHESPLPWQRRMLALATLSLLVGAALLGVSHAS